MNITKIPSGRSEFYMHTSDRNVFKRCRRKWYLSSPFRLHKRVQSTTSMGGVSPNLWFGSGIHYAMEDYHGMNVWGSPQDAFRKYVSSHTESELPVEWPDLYDLGLDMLNYYSLWEKKYSKWQTVWLDDKPLVEVNFALQLNELTHYYHPERNEVFIWSHKNTYVQMDGKLKRSGKWLERMGYIKREVSYGGTFDRIVEDEHGDWWILDYKTAKQFDTNKLPLDPQISAYCWAAEQWFGKEIKGMVYLQMHKSPPKRPKLTKKGVSSDKRQRTTLDLYLKALREHNPYGEPTPDQKEMIEYLKDKKSDNGDDFIRFDFVERTPEHKLHTYNEFIAEGKDMINPNLSIYPNPTLDCSWDCNFREMCIAYEEDADWEFYMEMLEDREEAIEDEEPPWRIRMYLDNPELFPEEYEKYDGGSHE